LPDAALQRLSDRLQALPAPAALRAEIRFELWMRPSGE